MNKGKITGLLLTGAMVVSAIAPMSVHAAETAQVPVSYMSGNIVQPPAADWGVAVPTKVAFTDDAKSARIDVSLEALDGTGTIDPTLQVDITVNSANDYKMTNGTSNADYELKYGATVLKSGAAADALITTLSESKKMEAGTAELTGLATVNGEHSDTLTYTITEK